MDLAKTFDCLQHDLIIAKLHAYGFEIQALKLIYSYLSNRFQSVKVKDSYGLHQQSKLWCSPGLVTWCHIVQFNDIFDIIDEAELAS